ncbi:MAG: DNA translocase FtsK 4TM domain-containing protein, partial [Candidatus Omnitrophica bacterium]|nr:DNA translocase FtsK 4TM domain-containing protein [Candidatus Omnitrophota bacterium]
MKTTKIKEIKLVIVLAIAIVVFVSLISFNPADIKFLTSNPNVAKSNIIGFAGA